ncbi:MAG: hypothetical protein A2Z83_03345 [Omnitrophica bacterium GWA2_52_8]|nr:MAG: hypothetical protein A2Z83_03345 [Omnitrophica bacterium GWA2_52_8]
MKTIVLRARAAIRKQDNVKGAPALARPITAATSTKPRNAGPASLIPACLTNIRAAMPTIRRAVLTASAAGVFPRIAVTAPSILGRNATMGILPTVTAVILDVSWNSAGTALLKPESAKNATMGILSMVTAALLHVSKLVKDAFPEPVQILIIAKRRILQLIAATQPAMWVLAV